MAEATGDDTFAQVMVKIGADISGLKDGLSQVGSMFKDLTSLMGLSLGIGGLLELGKASIEAASDAQQAEVMFAAALGSIGVSYVEVSGEANQYLEKIQEIDGFHKSEAQPALTKLIQMTGNYIESLKLLSLAANVARGSGQDLMQASTMLGRVYDGNTTMLKRFGMQVDKSTSSVDALAMVQKRFAGDGAAYMRTYAGQVQNFTNQWTTAKEVIGKVLIVILKMAEDQFMIEMDALKMIYFSFLSYYQMTVRWLEEHIPGLKKIFGDVADDAGVKFDGAFADMKKHFHDILNPTSFDSQTKAIAASVNANTKKASDDFDALGKVIGDIAQQGALDFANDFSASFSLFEKGTIQIGTAFKKMLDQMVQQIIKSGILNFIGLIFGGTPTGGFGILGNIFGGGKGGGGAADVPKMASGGIVNSPTLAMIGEAGPEAVIPLNQLQGNGVGGGSSTTNYITVSLPSLINVMDPSSYNQALQFIGNGLKAKGIIS